MGILRYLSFVALAGLAAEAHAATSPQIGTAAVTRNSVTGAIGGTPRALKRGDGVFQNDIIKTGQDAGAQLLFRDETALTMGPESQVTLDRLIYDPDKKTGEMSIRAVTGAFRFVTGSGPKAGYKIETPVGTIGVRGTIIQFVIKGRWLWVSLTEGAAVVCLSPTSCVTLDKPGTYAVTNGRQTSAPRSKSDEACGSGGGTYCTVFDDSGQTLYLYFLGIGQVLNSLTPAAGPGAPPPPTPGSGPPPPPPPPPTPSGFSPITNPGVGVPPGLSSGPLPLGLQDRCGAGSCTAPGPKTTPPGHLNTPPGQLKKP